MSDKGAPVIAISQANGKRTVLELLKDYGIEDARPEMSLRQCGLDSLEIVSLVQDLEAVFQIEIADEEYQKLKTIGDLLSFSETVR